MFSMMPKDAAAKLAANDSSLTKVEFVNNSVFQMKSAEYAQKIADGLRGNTHCKEVIIDKCSLMDPGAVLIAEALKENTSVERLMLPNNKLGPLSLIAIAECLKVNNTIKEFGLLGNSGSAGGKWGDASLTLLIEALEGGNTALTKIVWRLDNRLSWKITKLMSRNVELQRRRAAGMDVTDIDPRLTAKKAAPVSSAPQDEADPEEEKEIEPVKPPVLEFNGTEYMLTPEQETFLKKFKETVPQCAHQELLGGLVDAFLQNAKV